MRHRVRCVIQCSSSLTRPWLPHVASTGTDWILFATKRHSVQYLPFGRLLCRPGPRWFSTECGSTRTSLHKRLDSYSRRPPSFSRQALSWLRPVWIVPPCAYLARTLDSTEALHPEQRAWTVSVSLMCSRVDEFLRRERWCFSFWITMVVTCGCICVLGLDPSSWRRAWLSDQGRWEDRLARAPGIAALCGAWLGAAAIPLDWDVPWQSWPACSVLIAYAGFAVGCTVSVLRVLYG